ASKSGRLGSKTLAYYVLTSGLAAMTGLLLVNLIQPGIGAELGLDKEVAFGTKEESLWGIFLRMIPENVFSAFSSNGNMLQVIFFAILFGFFITRCGEKERTILLDFFKAAFEVMMKLATFALSLVPYGVFVLVVKVVGETGIGVFKPLFWYMLTVFLGLVIHSCVSLPLVLGLIGRVSPKRWVNAMSPALLTAFSTSSSSMTLPVTMDSVEKRGGVSNKVSSFVLPLGSTVNMDGTAIYECVGVIFLAQYYMGDAFTLVDQLKVVLLAMLASIGAAGIPSAGIVMMFTILSALNLPLEGAALILAVDRPLDMCRTMTNIWSDSCGTAVIAKSEGETLFNPPPEAAPGEPSVQT
ncbi:MAG: dicarboxylate/amino acid:cation symporter, partial [Planctomycetota bacterium]